MAKDIYLILQGDFGEIAKKEQSAYIKSRLRACLLGDACGVSRDCYFL